MTVVTPGAFRPASRMADLICAEATGGSIGDRQQDRARPSATMGQRPPGASERTSAPIWVSGSRMRRIGRLRSEASPSKVAVTPWPPTTPIMRREPVPALPKSSTSAGEASPPMPTPRMLQSPSPRRSTTAPSARQAAAVRSTSSPSSRPSTVGLADRSAPEDQGAVGDRLVARHARAPQQWRASAGGDGPGGAVMGAGQGTLRRRRRRLSPDGARDSTGPHPVTRAMPAKAALIEAFRARSAALFGTRAAKVNWHLTAALRTTNRTARFYPERAATRGETGTRHQAPMPELRREVLRPQQGPDRLPEVRHGFPGRRDSRPAGARRCSRSGRGRGHRARYGCGSRARVARRGRGRARPRRTSRSTASRSKTTSPRTTRSWKRKRKATTTSLI